jgi:hypothetical protein
MKPETTTHYSVRRFVRDEAHLLASCAEGSRYPPASIELPDGRLLPVPTDPLIEVLSASIDALRDGGSAAEVTADHLERIRLVIEFLQHHERDLMDAGLASPGDALAVREEFLDYLLNCDVEPDESSIPSSALNRFLDEWGHRWM